MGKIRTSIFEHGHTAQTEKKSKVTWWNAIVFRHCKSVTLYFSPLWSVKPWSQDWLIATGAYPGFCSMKRQEVFLLPLDGMLVHRRSLEWMTLYFNRAICQVSPTICWYQFIHLGGERHCESKVSCPRTQHNVPSLGSNSDRSPRSRTH